MTITQRGLAAVFATCSLATLSGAQGPVHIQLNGATLTASAVEVSGRVLVPVRGVMEKLGATVYYNAASQIVNASKGGTNVQLHIGSRQAMVNGQSITLDVPAQVVGGSTMVPLRFLSEALGATVDWNGQSNMVMITTPTGAAEAIVPKDPSANVQIGSFDRNPSGMIGSGGALVFNLSGTPGAKASVQIPGATGEVPMTEVAPGQYQAKVEFPADHPITLMGATAIARLTTDSGTRIMVLSKPMDIDTAPPAITNIWPKDTLVPELRPSINAIYNDGVGPGVDPASVTMIVDGQDVSHNVSTSGTTVSYAPAADLTPGNHTCELKMVDRTGNVNDQKWSFTTANAMDLAKSITVEMPPSPQAGQPILITMIGAPSSKATYSIGARVNNQPMTETRPGFYTATYTIMPNDQFYNERVIGLIHTEDNQTFALTAPQTVLVLAGPPSKPTFSSPLADAVVGDTCNIQGSGSANSRVHVWLEYRSTIARDMSLTGRLYDAILTTDANGNFSTGQMKIDPGLASSRDLKFTAHAEALSWDGKKSQASEVVFKKG